MKYDDLILTVGGFGRYQKFFFFLMFMTSVPNGLITLMFVFIHYLPDYRCKIPILDAINTTSSQQELLLNLTVPWETSVTDEFERSHCERYNITDGEVYDFMASASSNNYTQFVDGRLTMKCDQGWTYNSSPGFQSVVTQFNMVCDDSWKAPMAVSLYMVGMGLGAFGSALGDRFGRRPVFLWSTFLQFVVTGASGFVWSFPSYAAMMFLTGLFSLVNFLVAFVMAAEIMGVKHRNSMAIGPFIAFSIGYLFSPFVGYILQNWRWYMWVNGLCGIFYIPYYWVVPESPRWLIKRGRIEEAKQLLKKIAKVNKTNVDVDQIFQEALILDDVDDDEKKREQESSFFHVLFSKSLVVRIVVTYFAWCVTSTVYFALSLNTSNLSGSRFINCLLSAVVEGPGYAFSWVMLKYVGRPRTVFIFMGVSGICCFLVPLLQNFEQKVAVIVVAMLGKASISTVFYAVYFVVAELSPTLVRNFSSGVASSCARAGSFTAPYLLYAGERIHPSIPYFVMGGLAITSSLLTIIFVPETKGVTMPENKKEAESNRRYYGIELWKVPGNQIKYGGVKKIDLHQKI